MEQLVAGVEGRAVDVGIVERNAVGADEVSLDIVKTCTGVGIAGGRISNELVSGKQLDRPLAVFGNQHHA